MKIVKRIVDLLLTIVGGMFLLPLFLLIALAIKWSSPGPVIFRQRRVGLHGREFLVWKFRTMVCDGNRVLEDYLNTHPEEREEWNRDHKLRNRSARNHHWSIAAQNQRGRISTTVERPARRNELGGTTPNLTVGDRGFWEQFSGILQCAPRNYRSVAGLWS